MRDRWGLSERLFGFYYPIIMGLSELAGQRKTRRALLARARGRTLEIGPGNGYNLPHYTSAVSKLVLAEPNPHLSRRLRGRLESSPPPVGTVTGALQDALAPMNRYFGAGCNPNRRTEQTLRDSALTVEDVEHGTMPLAVPTLRPTILGTACR